MYHETTIEKDKAYLKHLDNLPYGYLLCDWLSLRINTSFYFRITKRRHLTINGCISYSFDTKTHGTDESHNILSSIYPLKSNKYKIHIQFNLVELENK